MTGPAHYAGRYNDGRHAQTTRVVISIGGVGIEIDSTDGTLNTTWPANRVRLTTPADQHQSLRLQLTDSPARLTIDDANALASLQMYCPNILAGITTSRREWRKIALWSAAAAAVVLAFFVVVIPVGAKWFAIRIPAPLEARLGRQVVDQITSIFARTQRREAADVICTSPQGQAVIANLIGRFEQVADPHLPITVTVIDHPLVNAFALPGGQILLFRGLIEQAEDGDQVAGVLAHEVGHVLHRHPTEIALKNTAGAGMVSLLVGDFTGGTAIAAATQLLLTSSNTRDAERQADATAVQLLNDLNISAESLAGFFGTTGADTFDGILGYLSTHPADADRTATVRALNTATGPAMTDQQWQALQQICG